MHKIKFDFSVKIAIIIYMTTLTIPLPKKEKERLTSVALKYGLSVDKLSRRVIADATQMLLEIPEESLDEYNNIDEIKDAFKKAVQAQKRGRLLKSIPKSLHISK